MSITINELIKSPERVDVAAIAAAAYLMRARKHTPFAPYMTKLIREVIQMNYDDLPSPVA